jgi:MraZ protein
MRVFSSNSTNKIDAKGRVSVPAGFRRALEHEEEPGLIYLIGGFPNPLCLEGMGSRRFMEYVDSIDAMPLDEKSEALAAVVIGEARPHQIDENGRIVLAPDLRARFGLEEEALFLGLGRTFQIWAPARWAARQADVTRLAREAFPQMSLRRAPPGAA